MIPTRAAERIALLDVLRGFGLLGIFVVNIVGSYASGFSTDVDVTAARAVRLLASDSFYPLFSLLFGIGFAVFLDRADRHRRPGVSLFMRRTLALAVIGLVQFIVLEPRDILLRYAALAMPLLAFRNATPRTLLTCSAAFLAASVIYEGAIGAAPIGLSGGEGSMAASRLEQLAAFRPRLSDIRTLLPIFACFLLGSYVWRSGLIARAAEHAPLLRRTLIGGLAVGLVGKGFSLPGAASGHEALTLAARAAAGPALMLGYAAGWALLSMKPGWRLPFERLAPLGRMALTNYLLQSVVMVALFSPGMLGLSLGTAACVTVAITSTGVQLAWSAWWLRRFQFGPAEWAWRTLTYGRLQPMRNGGRIAAVAEAPLHLVK